ncbi:uncharacterized protein [Rutidosis leptorrhynchoides]|uniref:uncharacterized protein n=1 Tax=Rutidosis leptorrhynchoides TaxID=125765 RepID=UPI003A99AB9A
MACPYSVPNTLVTSEPSYTQQFLSMLPPGHGTMVRGTICSFQTPVINETDKSDEKFESSNQKKNKGKLKVTANKNKNSNKEKKKGQSFQGESSVGAKPKKWRRQCKISHVGQCSVVTRRCLRCGIIGHDSQVCSYTNGVCWNFQLGGHQSRQCPYAKRSSVKVGSGAGAGVGSIGRSSTSSAEQKRKGFYFRR